MRTSQLIAEIESRNKIDPCSQLENLLKWVQENQPKRAPYFKEYHKRQKERELQEWRGGKYRVNKVGVNRAK